MKIIKETVYLIKRFGIFNYLFCWLYLLINKSKILGDIYENSKESRN